MIYIDGDFKARIAQINARGDDFTTFTVETIN